MIVSGVDPGAAGGQALIYGATADLIDGQRKPVLKETAWTATSPVMRAEGLGIEVPVGDLAPPRQGTLSQ